MRLALLPAAPSPDAETAEAAEGAASAHSEVKRSRGGKHQASCAAHMKGMSRRQVLTVDLFQQIILEHDERLNQWFNNGTLL